MYVEPGKIKIPADKVYGSQEDGLGKEYAVVKTLKEAGLDKTKKLPDLSKKERQILLESVLDSVKNLPVVISPEGRVFIIDGHHDFYILTQLAKNLAEVEVKLTVVKDYSIGNLSLTDFKKDLVAQGWVYGNVDHVVDHPVKVSDMADFVERSQMGLAFLSINEIYNVPLKGKYFAPFLQFRIVDLLKKENLYPFKGTDPQTIEALIQSLLSNQKVIQYMLNELSPSAPPELKTFLNEALSGTINP